MNMTTERQTLIAILDKHKIELRSGKLTLPPETLKFYPEQFLNDLLKWKHPQEAP